TSIGSGIWLMRDQRSSNGENITTRSDRIAHLAMFRLPCSHDKRRDNFDFPHYAWTKVRGKVNSLTPTCALPHRKIPPGPPLEKGGRDLSRALGKRVTKRKSCQS